MTEKPTEQTFPVVHLSLDGWSTEEEATATCFCGSVQVVLVSYATRPRYYTSNLAFSTLICHVLDLLQPLQKPGLINRHVCHCTDCRKIGSAFYQSNITVADSHMRYTRGEDQLTSFSEARTIRAGAGATMTNYFCRTCGTLMFRRGAQFPGLTILRTGTVDDNSLAETKLRPQVEQFIERRVAWSVPIESAVQVVGMHEPSDIEGIP